MATQIISTTSEQFPRQFKSRNFSRRKNISTPKRFRLSDIAVKTKVEKLPFEMNHLLFKLNVAHNSNFDITKEIEYSELSTELVKGLQERFDLKLNRINISETQIVVDEYLKHDLYEFPFKAFLRLEKKAPILYEAFIFFMRKTPLSIIDEGETSLLGDMTMEWLECLSEDKISRKEKTLYKNAIKEYKRNKTFLDGLKSNKTKEEVINLLNQYKPKKELYREIKEALLKWLDLDFSFYHSYPFQYYSEPNFMSQFQNEEEEEEREEIYDFFDFIYFSYTTNESLLSEAKQRFEDIYNNYKITNPCWVINLEEEESHIQKSIREFEKFTIEYFKIIEQL